MASKKAKRKDATGESDAYRRRKRPVRVRSWVFDWRNWPWRPVAFTFAFVALGATSVYAVNRYLGDGPRFRLAESGLAVSGFARLEEAAIRSVFSEDLGQSLADIPVEQRRDTLLETLVDPGSERRAVVAGSHLGPHSGADAGGFRARGQRQGRAAIPLDR